MKNIVLTGFMGAGKTAVGKELAHILGMKLIDVDTEIEKSEQITINEIFSQFGEPRFREIETAMIKKIAAAKNLIISTGGGAVLKQENMEILREMESLYASWLHPKQSLREPARAMTGLC